MKNKIPMKSFFGKDWKFFWRRETIIGNVYGVILNRLGMLLLKLSRKLLRKGGGMFRGEFYSNCSWCGEGSRIYGGHNHSISAKGARCISVDSCCEKKKV